MRAASATWSRATVGDDPRHERSCCSAADWRLLGAFGYLWFDIAVLWVCFHALGHTPPISTIVLAYQIGYLSNLIPIPGGIGVLDGSFVGMFVLFGVNDTTRDLGDDRLPRDLTVGPGDLGHGRVPAAAPQPQPADQMETAAGGAAGIVSPGSRALRSPSGPDQR